ncbi:MAG: hypothetical protein IT266_10140 [Saprospiraceae bacterium]|nr:hypothetical protein [Saprospiraceae bacterium]
MRVFQGKNTNQLYIEIAHAILNEGEEIVKDGRKIRELFPCVIKIDHPDQGILLVEGRPYNPAFLIAETLWNLTGDTTDWLCNYNKIYHNYFTDNKLEAGYGNRIFNWDKNTNQFELVAKRLIDEPYSQHADITIFNPSFDLKNPKFVPCITKLKFRIRDNQLHMTSFMRAQDIWLGFPYDINLLLTIFQLMAIKVNKQMGDYYHYCDVLRLYEANFDKVQNLKPEYFNCNNHIDLNNRCDFAALRKYRDIIQHLPENSLELMKDEPEYWQNGIKACVAYSLLHKRKFEEAHKVIDSITNCLKVQFEIWAKHYHKFFFEQSEII